MPPNQPNQPKPIVVSDKKISGPIHGVPCPWCGRPNDFKVVQEEIGASLEAGLKASCDHCRHFIIVTKVVPVVVVEVRQSKDTSLAPAPPAPGPQPGRSAPIIKR